MYLSNFQSQEFRNLKPFDIKLSPDLNVISGDNAAGKSSILEAIGYLIGGRSFRTIKQKLLVSHHSESFLLFGSFSNEQKLGVSFNSLTSLKRLKLNGEKVKSLSSVASIYPVQILSPESYHLIDSGPMERRKYLDWLLFHVEHRYHYSWVSFNKLLKQRNSFLRTYNRTNDIEFFQSEELKAWDVQYILRSNELDDYRIKLVVDLLNEVRVILKDLNFEFTDDLSISYYSGFTGDLSEKIKESFVKDCVSGNTQYGPHKADLRIKIGKHLAKDILSRGQKKILINCMYLAQTQLLKNKTEKDSLFIIDDFSSELDVYNQASLIEALRKQKNVQIILSCLQADMIKPLIKEYNNVKMFHVEHGELNVIDSNIV
jgi:DNA replication and repair protein RecF